MFINVISLAIALAAASGFMEVSAQNVTDALDIVEQIEAAIPGLGSPPPVIGKNVDGGNVYENFLSIRSEGQFFLRRRSQRKYEKPLASPVTYITIHWCSDVEFSDYESGNMPMGFTAKCVNTVVAGISEAQEAGAQMTPAFLEPVDGFAAALLVSSVFIPQANAFDMVLHTTADNWVFRWWDDGRPVQPVIGYEVHDEGDPTPNAGTSSWAVVCDAEWVSAQVTSELTMVDAAKLTPANFANVYEQVWEKQHARAQQKIEDAMADDNEDIGSEENKDSSGAGGRMLTSLTPSLFAFTLNALGF